ncbi:MAG: YARHG domain-containing protein [Flavobacteriales bacterium]|nr:YARHG domain-containing protein [Flavobacteriales bacterium]
MVFVPGINVVEHSYVFRASGSVYQESTFDYILTTGRKWAGGIIGDFTFQLDMGANSRFEVADVFGATANWGVVGIGSVSTAADRSDERDSQRIVRVVKGHLVITTSQFKPMKNIDVYGSPFVLAIGLSGDDIGSALSYAWNHKSLDSPYDEELTKEDLSFLRNMTFAQYGYVFKDPALRKTFEKFDWYIPDPNLQWSNNMLTAQEVLFVELIKLKEAE